MFGGADAGIEVVDCDDEDTDSDDGRIGDKEGQSDHLYDSSRGGRGYRSL